MDAASLPAGLSRPPTAVDASENVGGTPLAARLCSVTRPLRSIELGAALIACMVMVAPTRLPDTPRGAREIPARLTNLEGCPSPVIPATPVSLARAPATRVVRTSTTRSSSTRVDRRATDGRLPGRVRMRRGRTTSAPRAAPARGVQERHAVTVVRVLVRRGLRPGRRTPRRHGQPARGPHRPGHRGLRPSRYAGRVRARRTTTRGALIGRVARAARTRHPRRRRANATNAARRGRPR